MGRKFKKKIFLELFAGIESNMVGKQVCPILFFSFRIDLVGRKFFIFKICLLDKSTIWLANKFAQYYCSQFPNSYDHYYYH